MIEVIWGLLIPCWILGGFSTLIWLKSEGGEDFEGSTAPMFILVMVLWFPVNLLGTLYFLLTKVSKLRIF